MHTTAANLLGFCVVADILQRAATVAAYQAQLAAEAAAAATTTAAGSGSEEPQAAAKANSKPPAADKAGGAATGGSSRMGTPRTHGKPSAAGTDGCQLPPDVTLPEHGGFVAYFVEGGEQRSWWSGLMLCVCVCWCGVDQHTPPTQFSARAFGTLHCAPCWHKHSKLFAEH